MCVTEDTGFPVENYFIGLRSQCFDCSCCSGVQDIVCRWSSVGFPS
ncbi:hypothetical protein LINPERPRIM_LOCUS24927 [Linum perenne]